MSGKKVPTLSFRGESTLRSAMLLVRELLRDWLELFFAASSELRRVRKLKLGRNRF